MDDPKLTIRHLLIDEWDTDNTSIDTVPSISTGWFDSESNDPQVTVSNTNEDPAGIGTSPFTGIDPSGAGPVQDITGTVRVNTWSDRKRSDVNPKKLTWEFSEEIRRITTDNVLEQDDLRYIGYGGRRFLPDSEATPTLFRYSVTVHFAYQNRP